MTTHSELSRLIKLFADQEVAAEKIGDFLGDDLADYDQHELTPLIMAVVSEPAYEIEDVDVFMFHSYILNKDPKFAKLFADMWEICPTHSCDPEICSSDPESKCEGS